MHRFCYWSFVLAMLGVIPGMRAADVTAPDKFRLVHVQVLEADGKPAVHRDVNLCGWERRALSPLFGGEPGSGSMSDDLAKARKSGWLFTTDDHGKITVRIGEFAGWLDKVGNGRPGWGTYALVIEPGPDDAGAVSQRFWCGQPNEALREENWPVEWGQPLPLPPEGLYITMCLHKGFTLYGSLVDDRDHRTPLPNVEVSTWNDLMIDTHTGFGGQIFFHTVTTDSNGEFQIPHEYYNKLYVSMDGLWMTTEHDGWIPQEEDVIDPPGDDGLTLEFGVLIKQKFHYTGVVTDAEGKPVADADVVVGISSQPKAQSYGDTHHFERTKTDAEGKYDLAATSPWGTFLEAEDKAHGRVDLKWPGYDSPPIPPGRYDLTFPVKAMTKGR